LGLAQLFDAMLTGFVAVAIDISVKQHLGFEEIFTSGFDSVISHVHRAYCTYLLLHMSPPGVSDQAKSLGDKQRQLHKYIEDKKKRRIRFAFAERTRRIAAGHGPQTTDYGLRTTDHGPAKPQRSILANSSDG
jgi:hypothetical protein